MTSVGEEGLDIPKVDLVIFYEPIPSAIRTIQRRGRTGRTEKGNIIILTTSETRDEAYRWSAHHKERRMYRTLSTIKTKIKDYLKERCQKELTRYAPENSLKVTADFREKGSGIIKELIELGANTSLETLNTADYIASNRVGIEHKTSRDFVNSIIDGRLLDQIKELKNNYERPLIIVEGSEDIYSLRNIHPNAIRGMLATIAISYGIPVIHTKDFKESASLIYIIAKREQEKLGNDFTPHCEKRIATLKDQQEYFVSALPNIGLSLAKNLLTEFKTVKNLVNSSEEQIKKVEMMGDKKAKAVKDVFEKEYS
jgi:Fanconi anemia group M protein